VRGSETRILVKDTGGKITASGRVVILSAVPGVKHYKRGLRTFCSPPPLPLPMAGPRPRSKLPNPTARACFAYPGVTARQVPSAFLPAIEIEDSKGRGHAAVPAIDIVDSKGWRTRCIVAPWRENEVTGPGVGKIGYRASTSADGLDR
jgi:hypothetical protein